MNENNRTPSFVYRERIVFTDDGLSEKRSMTKRYVHTVRESDDV